MANWIKELNIKDSWAKAKNHEISTIELSKEIVEKLKRIKYNDEFFDIELENIIDEFEFFISDENDDNDEFDYIFGKLYDFGDQNVGSSKSFYDQKKALWIITEF